MQKTYTINGMTCEHCVNAITEEVSAIDGVSKVQVSLASNSMDVTSEAPIDLDTIKAAVDEAGDYTVAAATSLDTAGHPGGECGCGGHHHADSAESGCGCGGHEGHQHSADAAEKHASHGEGESCGCGHHQKAESGCGCGGHEGHHHSADAAEKHASHGEGESCGCGHHQKAETHSHVFAADGTQDAEPAGSGHKGFLGRLLHH
ncbi:copper chaperone [Acidipropionibacterium jensenii]|nr:copper chaperone [Acidipropionibacterium jensenii]